MAMKVGSARIDENGKISGGAAGDQTGKEVMIQDYYMHTKGWYMLRPKSVDDANKIAQAMTDACANNNIGYDQGNRLGVITQLKKYGSMKKIAVKTEADCSSLVRGCCMEAGFDPGNFTTANEVAVLKASGKFKDPEEIISSSMLYNGDILVTKTKGHTVVVTSGRPRTDGETYSGTFPALPPRGYYLLGDGYKTLTNYKTQIKRIQMFLNWAIDAGLKVDGKYGPNTEAAVERFQVLYGLTVDGSFGSKSLAMAKMIRK